MDTVLISVSVALCSPGNSSLLICSGTESRCVCQWKSIAAGETLILECTDRNNKDSLMFIAVSSALCTQFTLAPKVNSVYNFIELSLVLFQ